MQDTNSENNSLKSLNNTSSMEGKNNKKLKIALLKTYISTMGNEARFKFWIKTLLSSYSVFPEIIKTIDKIIEIQASNISFSSDVFNKGGSVYNQYEKIIDLSERKNTILNIFTMTKEMIKKLTDEEKDFIEKRFMYNWSIEEIARELDVSVRTVYRKIEKYIDKIYQSCLKNNWSNKFIESQTKNEGWLKEKYYKCVWDYFKNLNYKAEKGKQEQEVSYA